MKINQVQRSQMTSIDDFELLSSEFKGSYEDWQVLQLILSMIAFIEFIKIYYNFHLGFCIKESLFQILYLKRI